MVGYFANLALPRLGEVVKCGIVSRNENIKLEKVFGPLFVDRILDVLMLVLILALTLIFEFNKFWDFLVTNFISKVQGMTQSPIFLALIALLIVCLIVLFVLRKKLIKFAIFQKVKSLIFGFGEGIKTIGRLENKGAFLFHTFLIWIMYYLMTYVAFYSFAPTTEIASILAGLTVFTFGTLGIVVPSPGGLGSYHYLVTLALTSFYAVNDADAFSFANILFFAVTIINIVLGLISLIALPILNRKNPNLLKEASNG